MLVVVCIVASPASTFTNGIYSRQTGVAKTETRTQQGNGKASRYPAGRVDHRAGLVHLHEAASDVGAVEGPTRALRDGGAESAVITGGSGGCPL